MRVLEHVLHTGAFLGHLPGTVKGGQRRLEVDYVDAAVANKNMAWGHITVQYETAPDCVVRIANGLPKGILAHVTCRFETV